MVTETREGVGADFDNFWDWVQTRPRGTFAATFAIFAIFAIFAFFRCTFDVRFDTLGASIFTPGVPKWLFINLAEGTYKGQLTQQPIISFNLWVTSNYQISLVKNDWPPSPNLRFSRVKPRGLLVQRRRCVPSSFLLDTAVFEKGCCTKSNGTSPKNRQKLQHIPIRSTYSTLTKVEKQWKYNHRKFSRMKNAWMNRTWRSGKQKKSQRRRKSMQFRGMNECKDMNEPIGMNVKVIG